ncbi:MAG: alpha-L-fucosidase [Niabella sp.]
MKLKLLLLQLGLPAVLFAQTAPMPYGVLPSERQLQWQEMEMYALMHFTPTTFQNKEWGYGDADPAIFNPPKFNANQIVQAVKAGGFKGLTVVAKHHDGFCLWPTATTSYNITASPFRNGEGDLVKEMQQACLDAGLKMGIYCSPWDRNSSLYGKPEYVSQVFYKQLDELYTNYGPLFTVFFDGANGGDGYFGGAKEKRMIDRSTYYGFEKIWEKVRTKQPTANIFSDVGPDIRWVGNERGAAAATSWATITPVPETAGTTPSPGNSRSSELQTGTRNGRYWIPAECDVPMRPGWFYHAEQDGKTKTASQLLDIYYSSVGHGGCLDLGISPTPEGILSDEDVNVLKTFGDLLGQTFAGNLAKLAAHITASNVRGQKFSPQKLIDDDRYSCWATADNVKKPQVVFDFKKPVKFNVIRLRENIKLGQRIDSVGVDIWQKGNWKQLASATSIGGNRLIRLPQYTTASKLRLRVYAPVCIALSDFGLFAEPEAVMNKAAQVKDGNGASKAQWRTLKSADNYAIDNNIETVWTAADANQPALDVDMGTEKLIRAFTYLPPQHDKDGIVDQYTFYYSTDGHNWKEAASGEFSNIVNNPILQSVYLKQPVKARYFRFVAKRWVQGKQPVIAELGVIE